MSWLERAWPAVLVAFLYFATWPYHQGLNNPNEMVRVYMTRAQVRDHTPVIDQVIAEWGGVDDKAVRNGRYYSSKAPLQSLVGVPVYAALWRGPSTPEAERREVTTLLRRGACALPGLVFAVLVIGFLRRRAAERGLGARAGAQLGLTLALGSMLYPYAITFTGHIWAAITAGGLLYVLAALASSSPGSRARDGLSLLAGALAGAAPFAEYPAALIALPLLVSAPFLLQGVGARLRFLGIGALGGLPPFVLGLWAHRDSWGSPFKTGYAFLENTAYVQVHSGGFFGVGAPKLVALGGALFSPGTGLFFFTPVLALGVVGLVVAVLGERSFAPALRTPRPLAIAALVGLVLELAFISGHTGWRGGWTVGPRYIIAVAPLLGFFVIEALAYRPLRAAFPVLAGLSIIFTGAAAALYPHLSDVYVNPLVSFLWPAYAQGYASYGIADEVGLRGHAANAVHLVPLGLALGYVLWPADGLTARGGRAVLGAVVVGALLLGLVAHIPEPNADAARAENERLFGFWEPSREARRTPVDLLTSARAQAGHVRVDATLADGTTRSCLRETSERCTYGTQAWHHFAPETLEYGGRREPILFMHPIAHGRVRAQIPVPPEARRATLRYGLADASAAATNPHPVVVRVLASDGERATVEAGKDPGLHALPLDLGATHTASITVEITVEDEGARVFGFDVEFFRR